MSWGSTGGGGVGSEVGSPEAERGARALRDGPGPIDDDPKPRPGCLRALVDLVVIFVAVIVLVSLIGALLKAM